jgi:hypothetical protein
VVEAALGRGYAVVAPSSADRDRKCWGKRDPSRLKQMVRELREEYSLLNKGTLKLFAFGASSGGHLVRFLTFLHIRSLCDSI